MNEDSMASIVQAEMSSKYSSSNRMINWLDKQQTSLPPRPQVILGKDSDAVVILTRLLKGMEMGKSDAQLLLDRTLLRMNHEASLNTFLDVFKQHDLVVKNIKRKNNSATQSSRHVRRIIKSNAQYRSGESPVSVPATSMSSRADSEDLDSEDDFQEPGPSKRPKLTPSTQVTARSSSDATLTAPDKHASFLPGFITGEPNSFVGKCTICHRVALLALVLKAHEVVVAPNQAAISQFLSDISIEDIFLKRICCDACASYLIDPEIALLVGPVSGAIPLVPVKDNLDTWVKALNGVFSGAHVEFPKEKWAEYLGDKSNDFHCEDSDGVEGRLFGDVLIGIAKAFGDAVDVREEDIDHASN